MNQFYVLHSETALFINNFNYNDSITFAALWPVRGGSFCFIFSLYIFLFLSLLLSGHVQNTTNTQIVPRYCNMRNVIASLPFAFKCSSTNGIRIENGKENPQFSLIGWVDDAFVHIQYQCMQLNGGPIEI